MAWKKIILGDGTSSQYIKGDGSLDSTTYSTGSHSTEYSSGGAITGTLTITGATGVNVLWATDTSKKTGFAYDGIYTAGAQHQYLSSAQNIQLYSYGTLALTLDSNQKASFAGNVGLPSAGVLSIGNHTLKNVGNDLELYSEGGDLDIINWLRMRVSSGSTITGAWKNDSTSKLHLGGDCTQTDYTLKIDATPLTSGSLYAVGNATFAGSVTCVNLTSTGDTTLGGADGAGDLIKFGSATHAIYCGDANTNTLNVAYGVNGAYDLHLNYNGYNGGTTQFRNLKINDGKRGEIASFIGSDKSATFAGTISSGAITSTGGITGTTGTFSDIVQITSSTPSLLVLNPTASNYGGIKFLYDGATKGYAMYNSGNMYFGGESGIGTMIQSGGGIGLQFSATSPYNATFGGNVSLNPASSHTPPAHAKLNIGGGQAGANTLYRDIDIDGSWNSGEGHAITFTHGLSSSNMVGQIVSQHDSPGSRLRWGKLYHSGDSTTFTMELVSTSATTANLSVLGAITSTAGITGTTGTFGGDVGIGTFVSPKSLLDVVKRDASTGDSLDLEVARFVSARRSYGGSSSWKGHISLYTGNSLADGSEFDQYGENARFTWGAPLGANISGTLPNNSFLAISVNNNSSGLQERMRITNAGNVGIGTTSPTLYDSGSRKTLALAGTWGGRYDNVFGSTVRSSWYTDTSQNTYFGSIGAYTTHIISNDTVALSIDSSQNATFAGTIGSGAITSSGTVSGVAGTFTGALTAGSGGAYPHHTIYGTCNFYPDADSGLEINNQGGNATGVVAKSGDGLYLGANGAAGAIGINLSQEVNFNQNATFAGSMSAGAGSSLIGTGASSLYFDYMSSFNGPFIGSNMKRHSSTGSRMERIADSATYLPCGIAFNYQDLGGWGSQTGGINIITVGSNYSGAIDPEAFSRLYVHKDGNINIGAWRDPSANELLGVNGTLGVEGASWFSGTVTISKGGAVNNAPSNMMGTPDLYLGSETAGEGTKILMNSGNSSGQFIIQTSGSTNVTSGELTISKRSTGAGAFNEILKLDHVGNATFAGNVTTDHIYANAGNSYDIGQAGVMFNRGYFLELTGYTSISGGTISGTTGTFSDWVQTTYNNGFEILPPHGGYVRIQTDSGNTSTARMMFNVKASALSEVTPLALNESGDAGLGGDVTNSDNMTGATLKLVDGNATFAGSITSGAITATGNSAVVGDIRITGDISEGATTGALFMYGGAGAKATPTYSFYGDTNTGMYRTGADNLAFATNSIMRLDINSAGKATFAGEMAVAGTSTFTGLLSANGGVTISQAGGASLKLADSYWSVAIRSIQNSVSNSDMGFYTSDTSERMRLTSAGNFGIGTAAPTAFLAGANKVLQVDGEIVITGTNSSKMAIGEAGNSLSYVWQHANLPMLFGTNNTERMRILANGSTTFAGVNTISRDSGTYNASHVDHNANLVLTNDQDTDGEGVGITFHLHDTDPKLKGCAIVAERENSGASDLRFITTRASVAYESMKLSNAQALFTGDVQCGETFKSSDGTSGMNASKQWIDDGGDTHDVTIKDGLITAWTIS